MRRDEVVFKCRAGDRAVVVGIAPEGKHLEPVELVGRVVVVTKPCIRDGVPAWRLRKPVAFTVVADKTFNRRFYRAGHRLLAHYIADAALQPIRGNRTSMTKEVEVRTA